MKTRQYLSGLAMLALLSAAVAAEAADGTGSDKPAAAANPAAYVAVAAAQFDGFGPGVDTYREYFERVGQMEVVADLLPAEAADPPGYHLGMDRDRQAGLYYFVVSIPGDSPLGPRADVILQRCLDWFQARRQADFKREQGTLMDELTRASEQQENNERRLAELSFEVEQMVARLDGRDPREVERQVRDLSQQLREDEAELAVMTARREAIEDELARLANEVDLRMAQDAVAQELQEIVDLMERRVAVERELHGPKGGGGGGGGGGQLPASTPGDWPGLLDAEIALAEARARLAERREQTRSQWAGQIEAWQRELAESRIEFAVLQRRMESMAQQRGQLLDLPQVAAQYELIFKEQQDTMEAVLDCRKRVQTLRDNLDRMAAPKMVVLSTTHMATPPREPAAGMRGMMPPGQALPGMMAPGQGAPGMMPGMTPPPR